MKNWENAPSDEPQPKDAECTNVFYGADAQLKRLETKKAKLSEKYFEVESCLRVLIKEREIKQTNTWLELLIKATAKESARLYVKFSKLAGYPPVSIETSGVQ